MKKRVEYIENVKEFVGPNYSEKDHIYEGERK